MGGQFHARSTRGVRQRSPLHRRFASPRASRRREAKRPTQAPWVSTRPEGTAPGTLQHWCRGRPRDCNCCNERFARSGLALRRPFRTERSAGCWDRNGQRLSAQPRTRPPCRRARCRIAPRRCQLSNERDGFESVQKCSIARSPNDRGSGPVGSNVGVRNHDECFGCAHALMTAAGAHECGCASPLACD